MQVTSETVGSPSLRFAGKEGEERRARVEHQPAGANRGSGKGCPLRWTATNNASNRFSPFLPPGIVVNYTDYSINVGKLE